MTRGSVALWLVVATGCSKSEQKRADEHTPPVTTESAASAKVDDAPTVPSPNGWFCVSFEPQFKQSYCDRERAKCEEIGGACEPAASAWCYSWDTKSGKHNQMCAMTEDVCEDGRNSVTKPASPMAKDVAKVNDCSEVK